LARINDHYLKLKAGYLFPEIGRRVRAFEQANPSAKVIRLGIGDVTEPMPSAVADAMHLAIEDMSKRDTFRGYGPEQGYDFLRDKIAEHDFLARGAEVSPDEIFVSDGSKCDCGNILDVLATGANVIAVTDPVYPVYVDTNVMAGNTGAANERGEFDGIVYLPATAANGFSPEIPTRSVDVIYLCSPNNPTGAVLSREVLARWVSYARRERALILFDAAYESFITDPSIPHSIYEIPGARDVAIEFRSFSKTAGFTGTRCAFTVVPKSLMGSTVGGEEVSLHALWTRRHTTKFNGVGYVVQRGAAAVYGETGHAQVRALVDFYLENARIVRERMADAGLEVHGGVNAPYVWIATPAGPDGRRAASWAFFDRLLTEANVVVTPGSGFGGAGEGYVRISAFSSRANVEEATSRIARMLR